MSNIITGQLIFRKTDKKIDGKEILMTFGLLGIQGNTIIQGEHQYVVSGLECKGVTQLHIHMRQLVNVSEYTIGNTPGGIFTTPIWRV